MSEKHGVDGDPKRQDATKSKRIAVVAIHGVGDHPQFATAREIGDLLSNLEYHPSKTPRYAPFTEVMKRINVRPVRVADEENHARQLDLTDERPPGRTRGPMHALAQAAFQSRLARPPSAQGRSAAQPAAEEADNSANSLDHLFMKGQLIDYKGEKPEDTYQCLRLEGRRVAPAAEPGAPPEKPAPEAAGVEAVGLLERGVQIPEQTASPATEDKTVHIYEMYWADLSRLSNAFTQVFGELYQLLFHLGSVSVNNVLAAAIHFQRPEFDHTDAAKKWHRFSKAQGVAADILAWPIPILNLYMAALVPVVVLISLMRSHLSAQGEFVALDALAGFLAVALCGYLLSRARTIPRGLFPAPLLAIGVLCIGLGFLQSPWTRDCTEAICAVITLVLGLGGVWLIVQAYDKQRPGSKAVAGYIGGILLLVTLIVAFRLGRFPIGRSWGYPAIAMCLNVMEIAFGLLSLAWAAFYACYMWAHWAGWRAVRAVKCDPKDYAKACRARWTAQLVLALSSVVFLTLTLAVWTGVIKVAVGLLPGQENAAEPFMQPQASQTPGPSHQLDGPCQGKECRPVEYAPVSAGLYRFAWRHGLERSLNRLDAIIPGWMVSHQPQDMEREAKKYTEYPPLVGKWTDQMLLAAGIAFLPFLLAAVAVALLFTGWALFPSVADELSPPDSGPPGETTQESEQRARELSRESSSLGIWLDRGFRFMRWGGELLYWTMWLPLLLFVLFNFKLIELIYRHWGVGVNFIGVVGTLVAGTALGLLGFAGRINSFAKSFRPLLRVMLDVDNWLREHPRDSNPTARICGRYVSLLRHISGWRDADDKGYEAMVIIAHSQGTAITADFLRFLHVEKGNSLSRYDPELKLFDNDFPIYFFTMGCPLYQLYGLRFPYLYGWARNETAEEAVSPDDIRDLSASDAPVPDHLGVKRWINAYRSGDYVGRHLWRGGEAAYEWDPSITGCEEEWNPPPGKPKRVFADHAGKRIEFCIGPGAHTHYWDHTAGLIAEVLDRMINDA